MHVVMFDVEIDTARNEEALTMLHDFAVPMCSSQPGFVKGAWLSSADGAAGRTLLWFENEAQAHAMVDMLSATPMPADAPVSASAGRVFSIVAEA